MNLKTNWYFDESLENAIGILYKLRNVNQSNYRLMIYMIKIYKGKAIDELPIGVREIEKNNLENCIINADYKASLFTSRWDAVDSKAHAKF